MLGQNEALNLEMNNTGSNASGHRHAESMGKHFDRKLQLEDMLSGCAPNKRFKSDEVTIPHLVCIDHLLIFVVVVVSSRTS